MANSTLRDRARAAAEERQAATAGLANEVLPPGTKDHTGKEVAQADPMRAVLDAFKSEIAAQLPKTGIVDVDAFVRGALTGIKTSKQALQLSRCTRPSLFAALLECARLGLMPFTNEGTVVPFGDQATFIPMYQGYVTLFFRTGQVARVVRGLIYQADEWDLAYGDGGGFYHKPALVNRETGEPIDRGKPLLAYCYLVFRDGSRTEVTTVTRAQAEEVMQNYSKSWALAEQRFKNSNGKYGRDSAWHTDFPKMWEKTAIRLHARDAPKSPELITLMMIDRRDDTRVDVAAQAPPPPMPPMPPADEGIDWSKDLAGNTIQGEVVDERDSDGFPAGSVPAGQPAGNGHPDQDQERPASGVPDETPASGPAPDAGPAPDPAAGGEPKVTPRTAGQLNIRFSRIGWQGDAKRDDRMLAFALLAHPGQKPPRPLESTTGLTEPEALKAIRNFDTILANLEERARIQREEGNADAQPDMAGALQRIVDEARAKSGTPGE